jgi:cytochrome c oxidase assembly protein subunit 15
VKATAEGTAIGELRFARFAWGVLAYNVGVVLWGAYVRASSSGAGCGGHWPLCNGEVIPTTPRLQTIIEFSHRLSSGLAFFSVLALFFWARRVFARRTGGARLAAGWALALMIAEALLGAGLVIFGLVDKNASVGRAIAVALHLTNTHLLLAALAMTAWLATRPEAMAWPRAVPRVLLIGLALVLAASITGAIAALGDTLFPAASVRAGVEQELAGGASLILRLRVLHPLIAVLTGMFLLYAASTVARLRPFAPVKRMALAVALLALVQLAAGAVNIALLAPVWMQLLHLLLADLVWLSLVLLTARTAFK